MQNRLRELETQIGQKLSERDDEIGSLREQGSGESERIKKLEDLLARCKENIKSNKDRINTLTAENDRLQALSAQSPNTDDQLQKVPFTC